MLALLKAWLVLEHLDDNDGEIWHVVDALFILDDDVTGVEIHILLWLPLAVLFLHAFEMLQTLLDVDLVVRRNVRHNWVPALTLVLREELLLLGVVDHIYIELLLETSTFFLIRFELVSLLNPSILGAL